MIFVFYWTYLINLNKKCFIRPIHYLKFLTYFIEGWIQGSLTIIVLYTFSTAVVNSMALKMEMVLSNYHEIS